MSKKDIDQEYREYVIREVNEAMKCKKFYTHEEAKAMILERQQKRLQQQYRKQGLVNV